MHRLFRFISKSLAGLLVPVFILTLLTGAIISNAENKILNANTYLNALAQDNIYQQLPSLLAGQIVANLSSGEKVNGGEETPIFLKFLTTRDWQILLELILPPETTRDITENAIIDIFDVLNDNSDSATINLLPIKRQLLSNGPDAFLQILRAQPACSPEQSIELQHTFSVGGDINKLCRPSDDIMQTMLPDIETGLIHETANLPDKLIIFDPSNIKEINSFQQLRTFLRFSLLIPLIILALITLLAVRTLKNWLRWWGFPFTITGGLMVFFGFSGSPIMAALLKETNSLEDESMRMAEAILSVLQSISQSIFQPLLIWGLIFGLLGMLALLATQFLPQDLLNSE